MPQPHRQTASSNQARCHATKQLRYYPGVENKETKLNDSVNKMYLLCCVTNTSKKLLIPLTIQYSQFSQLGQKIQHTLRYRVQFSVKSYYDLKFKSLTNCFKSLFLRCIIVFYISCKKYKSFVTCDMSQPCNMPHFEKIFVTLVGLGLEEQVVKFINITIFLVLLFILIIKIAIIDQNFEIWIKVGLKQLGEVFPLSDQALLVWLGGPLDLLLDTSQVLFMVFSYLTTNFDF